MVCGQLEVLSLELNRRHSISSRLPLDEDYANSMRHPPHSLSRLFFIPLFLLDIST